MSNYKESTMGTCKTCGSHAINPGLNGRPTFDKLVDHDLCDVCFWSTRFQSAADEIDRLRAENEALKSQWQPMETAPMDGSHILLYRPEMHFVGYHCDSGWCVNAPGLPIMDPPPTRWMQLPPNA